MVDCHDCHGDVEDLNALCSKGFSKWAKSSLTGEVRVFDPETGGQKGSKDERFDLMPWDALAEVARVYGANVKSGKYPVDNWTLGYAWRLSLGALFRHAGLWSLGYEKDDGPGGTGCHHLACVAWHCLTLITFGMRKLGTDDRKKVPPSGETK